MDPMENTFERDEARAVPAAKESGAPLASDATPQESAADAAEASATPEDSAGADSPEPAEDASAPQEQPETQKDAEPEEATASAPPAAEDFRASEEYARLARTMPPAARELEGLAVTEPLKTRRGGGHDAALVARLAAAIVEEPEPHNPLAPGETLAGYTIERLLRTEEDGPIFLATPPAAETAENAGESADVESSSWRYIAREVPAGDADRIERVVAAGARGPGLLAPVAFAREGERAFVIGLELPGSGAQEDQAAPRLSAGERLRPVDALTACTQLGAALSALHHAGLAHLNITPEQVALYDGRVYLGGVEDTTPVDDPEEGAKLYARDANSLARTIGALGGANDVALWDHDTSAQRSVREMAARGQAGSYTTADEVTEAGSLGLQILMVAGARMGSDIRSVRLRLDWGAASSVGRVRSENQDAWAATQFAVQDDAAADAPMGVFLVADGMGGEAHGEVASRFVARLVTAEMAKRFLEPQAAWPALAVFTAAEDDSSVAPHVPLDTALEQAVKEANRRTRAFSARINATTGSTVTALAVMGARAALAHLGDSRAYLLRDGQLLQLTEDHSLMARLEAMKHPLLEDPNFMMPRSVLYRSIGQDDDVEVDMLQFVLSPGDRIMMCSDGLWDELPREVIEQTLTLADDPHTCAGALVQLANASGGHDNSTAVVLFVHAQPTDQPFEGATPEELVVAAQEATSAPPEEAEEISEPEAALAGLEPSAEEEPGAASSAATRPDGATKKAEDTDQ